MSETGLIQILEGALMAAGKPLTVAQLGDLFEEQERPENAAIRESLEEIAQRCEDRGFELKEVASGFRFQVRQNLSTWIGRLWQERPPRYSRALLETLALIAYRQPITRGEIEEIRGVAVSSNIIKTLHEREWIRVVGHRDVPGRPAMYATTRQFLDYFNLKSLDQLPALAEIRDLETLNAELGFSEPLNPDSTDVAAEQAEDADGDGDGDDSSPGLTVVGGTEHTPVEHSDEEGSEGALETTAAGALQTTAEGAEASDNSESQSEAEEASVEPTGMSLADAAQDLEDRASFTAPEQTQEEAIELADDAEVETSVDSAPNYVQAESTKPESQG